MTSSKKFRTWHKTNTLFKSVANENSNNNFSQHKSKAWSRDFDLFSIKRFSFPVMRSPAILCLLVVLDTSGGHNLSNQIINSFPSRSFQGLRDFTLLIVTFKSFHFFLTFASPFITGCQAKAPITSTREFPWKVVTNLFASSIPS